MERTPSARRAVTSRSIEVAAIRLVAEHGFDSVTVDQICAAAGVSQRTFFNHFPTKVAAVLGAAPLRVDESVVRQFLASDNPRLIDDLLMLAGAVAAVGDDPELARDRFRVVAQNPALLAAEMLRLTDLQSEMAEVLTLRLARSAEPGENDEELRAQATLLSYLLAAILRYEIEGGKHATPEDVRRRLDALLPKLVRG